MLCPCCGSDIEPVAKVCDCGARFVGEPLGPSPFKVQRLGAAMSSVALLTLVVGAALIFTKWLALAAALVLWSSWRAMQLARREPDSYGGYRTAMATFSITLIASLVSGGYAVAYIPEYLQLREDARRATTMANLRHVQALLEEYKHKYNAYPSDLQALRRISDETLPGDYWDKSFGYQSYTAEIASGRTIAIGVNFHNFELRSAGPDEKMGTDDDIIMRDGLFISVTEARKQPVSQ
ncbi:MAG TPA: hypothetical protein VLD57_13215, partial [Blastocatellia bacterium]|nr:hypothetical protein [Blastocatellia bacterium]